MQGSAQDPLRKIQAQHPPETKADIGSALKAARQKKGQSVEAVVSQTRIPKKFIEALEGNRLEEFPALAYLRGFLRTYCDYLEIEFETLWAQITPAPAPAAEPESHGGAPHAKHDSHETAPKDEAGFPAAAAIGVTALVSILLALFLRGGGERRADAPDAHAATPAALEPVHAAAEPTLALEFRDDAWLSLAADGATVFEGRVPKNSRQDWKGRKVLSLRTNSPEVLRLTLNGEKFSLPAPDPLGAYRIELP